MSEPVSTQNCRGQFENEPPLINFTPVAVRARHDGRNVERQIAFKKLADCGSVTPAATRAPPRTRTRQRAR